MRDAVIVSTARTPIGKAYKGSLSMVQGPVLAGHSVRGALEKVGIQGDEVQELILGCALTQGTNAANVARHTVFAADLPDSVAGLTVDRQCASGLSAIGIAAQQVQTGQSQVLVAGGVDTISLVQTDGWNEDSYQVPGIRDGYYLSMLETAEIVASRYGISRAVQDDYALMSQQRTAVAQREGLFDEEILPFPPQGGVTANEGFSSVVSMDECNRPATTLNGLSQLTPIVEETGTVTAGNASQLSDGAAACVVVSSDAAKERQLEPLGVFHGMITVGCAPEEMGIGPVLAIPPLLERFGLQTKDIDLWEINEAFASQVVYCAKALNIPIDKLNVNGGSISLGHPYGMSGARLTGHALLEGRRRGCRFVVVSLCVGWGMGSAALLEIKH